MKRIIFIILLITLIMACKAPDAVNIPDKHLSFKNGVVFYKEDPYTGKVSFKKIPDKDQLEEGYMYLKNGKLDGTTEFKNEISKTYFKFNVKEGKFNGEYILKHPLIGDFTIGFDNGSLKELKGKFSNDITQDIIFDKDGNINGLIEQGDEKLDFKGGIAQKGTLTIKMYLDKETRQKLITEVYENGKLMAKEENILLFTVEDFEEELLPLAELK